MMPKMDGNELTRRVKNNENTCHIPVILLSAKLEQESKLEGLSIGADAYLTKPFDTKELIIRIKSLLNIRRKLQEKYSKGDFETEVDEKSLSPLDKKFMNTLIHIIEEHISEEEFRTDVLSNGLGMSRMHMHRKLKALTGKSSSQYIRFVKLRKAKEMIKNKQGNISEIAYSLGFSSPAYFTRCFKEEFGFPPSGISG